MGLLYSDTSGVMGDISMETKTIGSFTDVRGQEDNENFNIFFDCLVPCIAGKKAVDNRYKITYTVTDGGKVSVTDEAFTELQLLNYWNKWSPVGGQAKWTDSRAGNTHYKGWHLDAYKHYQYLCERIQQQRSDDSKLINSKEKAFQQYALDKYGREGRRHRGGAEEVEGPELFNELD
jgi:hypothetical protein